MEPYVQFDVFVLNQGRWDFHSRYPATDEKSAIELARSLDREAELGGAKVVKVSGREQSRDTEEAIIWVSLRAETPGNPARQAKGPDSGTQAQGERPVRWRLMAKVFAIVAFAGLTAFSLSVPLSLLIGKLPDYGWTLSPAFQNIAVFTGSILVFLGALAICAYLFVSPKDFRPAQSREPAPDPTGAPAKPAPRPELPAPAPEPALPPPPAADENLQQLPAAETASPATGEKAPMSDGERQEAFGPLPSFLSDDTDEPQAGIPTLSQPPIEDVSAESIEADAEPAAALAQEPTPAKSDTAAVGHAHRVTMLRFLEAAVTVLKDAIPDDRDTSFALALFLGGAGEQFGQSLGLRNIQRLIMVRECLTPLGLSPEDVETFCEHFTGYGSDPTHRIMVEAGAEAMAGYLEHQPNCFTRVGGAIQDWHDALDSEDPSDAPEATDTERLAVAVLLTDLSEGTAASGDAKVLRVHNSIVRNALARSHGEELRHTGDGILAIFASPLHALAAAIHIHTDLARHNRATTGVPVHVRIGVVGGDADPETFDLSEPSVRRTAEVCDTARAEQIVATQGIVRTGGTSDLTYREISDEQSDPSVGEQLYEVVWNEG